MAVLWLVSVEGWALDPSPVSPHGKGAPGYFETFCFDCHDDETQKGGLDLVERLSDQGGDLALVFERLITSKMPPRKNEQPNARERDEMLRWLASRSQVENPRAFRRLTRFEFIQSANDLLGIDLDVVGNLPEDRGTHGFDSNRRIQLTREMLGAYFSAIDEMLEFALPETGFPAERIWLTNRIKDSHRTYNIYTRPYRDGILFSWTRANNGNSYSFFYDGFEPPEKGWYELTFDAMKLGDFSEDVSLMVFAGKYYFADDRPQPQRLLDVISLGNREVKSHTIRAFLHPGENVSVHCYSKHNFRQQDGDEGAYIEQLKIRGPILDSWPPQSYQRIFSGLPLAAPPRVAGMASRLQSNLQAIGGRLLVSSEQEGMEKQKMQDGSNRTFWHTRFSPTLAEPPHFVILENPNEKAIEGLSYATWSGGNGNGQVEAYAIYVSDDGESWGEPIQQGRLEIRLASQQPILFPRPTRKRFLKFLVTEAFSLDERTLASIGKLDVLTEVSAPVARQSVRVNAGSTEDYEAVIRSFAEQAFFTQLSAAELEPYFSVGRAALVGGGDLVGAVRLGIKSVLSSPRFLMVPGEYSNQSFERAATLARILWLSVPDQTLFDLAAADQLRGNTLTAQIERMLLDARRDRMVHSFCAQWLNLRAFGKVTPSLKLYPLYDDLLERYLPMETEAYVSGLIRENRPVGELIDSDYSFLNQRLAQHYGIGGVVGQHLRRVAFGAAVPRGGLLTMGSILKVTADGFDTSPILRGAWISKNIAGNMLSPPPENIVAIETMPGVEPASLREQIAEHKNNQACIACHKSIDSYGFGLESFDATGQWRERYRVKEPHRGTFQYRPQGYYRAGAEVDPSGAIDGERFVDVFGFKKLLLSDHRKIAYNFIKKFFEYANGYEPDLRQRFDLFAMIPADPDECRLRDLIVKTLTYSVTEATE